MELLIVRHGESEGNAEGRLQGHVDSPLTARGRGQAALLGEWLKGRGLSFQAAYVSPLARARQTAEGIAGRTPCPEAVVDEDLREVGAGSLEGLNREEIFALHPTFATRAITELGDFSEYGGESYEAVQQRIGRFLGRMDQLHSARGDRVLIVAHGGTNFQLVKAAICVPTPRVCILAWGNCTATLLRYRDRRGLFMAEVAWHVPLELTGGEPSPGTTGAFR